MSEIRRSLDRHTILYTTLIELSRALGLRNCAVWMPNKEKKKNTMNLTHELWNRNDRTETESTVSIPMNDPDVAETVGGSHGVKILGPDRPLAVLSSGGSSGEEEGRGLGPVAAIRMPMLRVSNFKGGTPDPLPASYAILVLVLPGEQQRQKPRTWTASEIEMVKVGLKSFIFHISLPNTRARGAMGDFSSVLGKQRIQVSVSLLRYHEKFSWSGLH